MGNTNTTATMHRKDLVLIKINEVMGTAIDTKHSKTIDWLSQMSILVQDTKLTESRYRSVKIQIKNVELYLEQLLKDKEELVSPEFDESTNLTLNMLECLPTLNDDELELYNLIDPLNEKTATGQINRDYSELSSLL